MGSQWNAAGIAVRVVAGVPVWRRASASFHYYGIVADGAGLDALVERYDRRHPSPARPRDAVRAELSG